MDDDYGQGENFREHPSFALSWKIGEAKFKDKPKQKNGRKLRS